jgi:hypothetical protein
MVQMSKFVKELIPCLGSYEIQKNVCEGDSETRKADPRDAKSLVQNADYTASVQTVQSERLALSGMRLIYSE